MPLGNFGEQRTPTGRTSKQKPAQTSWREKALAYNLDDWYASEDIKRNFGSICRAVNVQKKKIHLLGSEIRPLAALSPANIVPASQFDVIVSIDEAKADWSSVIAAAMFYGTTFRIDGSHHTHAVLQRHQLNRHSALRYRRPQLEDIPQNVSMLLDDLREMSGRFSDTTSLIDRRFKEVWREKNL